MSRSKQAARACCSLMLLNLLISGCACLARQVQAARCRHQQLQGMAVLLAQTVTEVPVTTQSLSSSKGNWQVRDLRGRTSGHA